jgi:hypothetical protein
MERLIENFTLTLPRNQAGMQRPVKFIAVHNIDCAERIYCPENMSWPDRQARTAEGTNEMGDVFC